MRANDRKAGAMQSGAGQRMVPDSHSTSRGRLDALNDRGLDRDLERILEWILRNAAQRVMEKEFNHQG